MWEKIKAWWDGVKTKPLLDRIFNKETLYAIIIGGTTLGFWQVAPEKVETLTATLVGFWTVFKLLQSSGGE